MKIHKSNCFKARNQLEWQLPAVPAGDLLSEALTLCEVEQSLGLDCNANAAYEPEHLEFDITEGAAAVLPEKLSHFKNTKDMSTTRKSARNTKATASIGKSEESGRYECDQCQKSYKVIINEFKF